MKSIKTSLFVAAALAVALSFASCSNGTQDVYVTNNNACVIAGKVSGSMASATTGSSITYTVDTERFATVSYNTAETAGNKKVYKLTLPFSYTYGGVTTPSSKEISLSKIGDKYYFESEKAPQPVDVKDSLEDDEFTITTITVDGVMVTNLKFKKAE